MSKQKKCQLVFGDTLTAYEAADNLAAVNKFLKKLDEGEEALIDASAVQHIDTAGCQMVDLAIAAANLKKAKLEVKLSDPLKNAFQILGFGHEEYFDETG